MLVQSMAALTRRFQNVRGAGERDPLANLTLEPLRPLSNLLFGYLQDERDRLSLVRRVYEYDNEYGIRLVGRAVPVLRPAESRSKFLEAFHNLLYVATEFYLQADDMTVVADGFKVLNALREVHLLLSQGRTTSDNDSPGARGRKCFSSSGSSVARSCASSCPAGRWSSTRNAGWRRSTP